MTQFFDQMDYKIKEGGPGGPFGKDILPKEQQRI